MCCIATLIGKDSLELEAEKVFVSSHGASLAHELNNPTNAIRRTCI